MLMLMNSKLGRLTLLLAGFTAVLAHGQAPTLVDPSFNADGGADDDIFAITRDATGFLVGGQFTHFAGVARGRLARLHAGGTLDDSFFVGVGANSNIYTVAIQADGKILIGGTFTRVHGENRAYLARLEADGRLDSSFIAPPINNELRAIDVDPDGRILIAGRFTSVDGQDRNRIARLLPTGGLDSSFQPGLGANDNIRTLLRLADGSILIGGQFTRYNGADRVRLARLLASGALDPSFDPGLGANGQVRAMATNASGSIYVGGDFSQFNGTNRAGAARLRSNGALDLTFNPTNSPGAAVRAIAVEPGGQIWMGGAFTMFGGQPRFYLASLLENGAADQFFQPFPVLNNEVFSIVPDGTGGIVFGGDFRQIDGQTYEHIARLNTSISGVAYRFTTAEGDVGQEDAGAVSIVVQRVGAIATSSSVELVVHSGTAIVGEDFLAIPSPVTFAPFESSRTIDIPLRDDALAEGPEWFEVELIQPPGTTSDPLNPRHRVTILDNEFQVTVDETFQPDFVNGTVLTTAVQPDGKVVIGGEFTYRGGCLENYLSRLNTNGTVDCDFTVHSVGANGPVRAVALQTNGCILAGGAFTLFNSQAANFLVRLQTNGITDDTFHVDLNLNFAVLAIAVQPDGRILVGGMFSAYGEVLQAHVLRLEPDGSLDADFRPTVDGFVRSVRLTTSNRVLIAGDFTHVNGVPRSRIARLRSDGTLDPTFNPAPGPDGSVMEIAELSDGRLMIAGEFSRVDTKPRPRLARLTVNGTLDSTFDAGSLGGGPRVNTVAVQADGKVAFGGLFDSVGEMPRPFLARVLINGALDTGFPSAGANGPVHTVRTMPNGQLLVAGNFTEVGGLPRRYVARLNPEPTVGRLELIQDFIDSRETAGSITLTIRRVGPSDGSVTVDYETVPGTAQPGVDFQSRAGTLIFNPLETLKSIVIPIVNDGLPEATEQFEVRLQNPGGGAFLSGPTEATLQVTDNDRGLDVLVSSLTIREGAANALITLRRNSDGPGPVSVDFATVNGSAMAGSDFLATNGTVTFLAEESEKTIPIALLTNPEFEGRESFRFILSNPSPGIVLGTNGSATIYLEDQDSAFEFGIINDSEEGGWPALCYVERHGLLTQTATVRVRSTGGTATAGADYVPVDLLFTFAPGEYLKEFYVTNRNDGLVEGPETVGLSLSTPTGLAILNQPSETFTTILDNDLGIEFIADTFFVNEFAAQARAVVRRGDDGTGVLTVRYSTGEGTAKAGTDFVPQTGTLTLAPGETNGVILIPLVADRLLEAAESFRIELSQPGPGAALGTQSVAQVILLDDELAGSVDVTLLANPDDVSPWFGVGVYSISPARKGQLIVGSRTGLTRLNSDGSKDTNFVTNPFENYFTPVTLIRPDGKLLVGGSSSNTFAMSGDYSLRLLQTNGTPDPGFTFANNASQTAAIALQDDGRIIIGGDYAGAGPLGIASILRVLPTGALDPSFTLVTFSHSQSFFIGPPTVEAVTIQPDGKILAVGRFLTVDGLPRPNIVRLTSAGIVDPTFQGPAMLPAISPEPGFFEASSRSTAVGLQRDGRIIVAGSFTNLGGVTARNVARLHPNGTLDLSFQSPLTADQTVKAVVVQSDGKMVVAVSPVTPFGSPVPALLCRLLENGAFDPGFEISHPDQKITSLVALPGGDLVIGGDFLAIDGIPRPYLARLRGDGLVLQAQPASFSERRIELFNTWPGGISYLESSTDLMHWQSIRTNQTLGTSQVWFDANPGPTWFYRARHIPAP